MAYEVGPGDAVFTTPFTFFATCEAIALLGATPVFVDIDPITFNLDPFELEKQINRVSAEGELKLRGIIPVDLFGLPCDYDSILTIAEKFKLFVIEDAAQAFGATYKGKKAPGLGHVGTTSFFPAKPLGCYGDGGAIFTDDDELVEKIRSLIVHGKGRDKYNNIRIGLNARLDTIQAAILIEKLKIYPEEIEIRNLVARRYSDTLGNESLNVLPPQTPIEYSSVWAQYTVKCKKRDELQMRLREAGIPSMIYYVKPMHLLDAMNKFGGRIGDYPMAENSSREVLSLPFYPYLSEQKQEEVLINVRLSSSL